MIFVTGDIHGEHSIRKFNSHEFPEGSSLTKNDYVICTGDFGLIWDVNQSGPTEQYWLDWLSNKPWTTLFVDGNHECISHGADVLTERGWMNIVEAYKTESIKIANFNQETKKIYFDYPISKIKTYKDKCIIIDGKNTKQIVSLDHDIILNNNKVKAKNLLNCKIRENEFILKGNSENKGADFSDEMIKLLTWVIMDGTIVDYSLKNSNSKKCRIQFKLSRQDKIDNLITLLTSMNLPYTYRPATIEGKNKLRPYYINLYSDTARMINRLLSQHKQIPTEWKDFNKEQVLVFLNTLTETDGTQQEYGNKAIVWRSTNIYNLDIVQEFCIKNNLYCVIKKFENMSGFVNGKTQYICRIYHNKDLDNFVSINETDYNDYMYCFTMPLGTLITRIEGKIAFTGNCFTRLNAFPRISMFDGKVGVINSSIYHLLRGEIYTIENNKFFTFGGAHSIDKLERRIDISWWSAELPSYSEIENAYTNLDKHNWDVDYVLTHTAPRSIIETHLPYFRDKQFCPTADFLNEIHAKIKFRRWYFGHFHREQRILDKYICQYDSIQRII